MSAPLLTSEQARPLLPKLTGDLIVRRDELLRELRPIEAALDVLTPKDGAPFKVAVTVDYPRTRARRGHNRTLILGFLPHGARRTAANLADATGIPKPVLATSLSQMKRAGVLGNEHGEWFRLPEEASA